MVAERNIKHFTVILLIFAVQVGYKYKKYTKEILRQVNTAKAEKQSGSLIMRENGLGVLYLHIVGGPDNAHTSKVHCDNLQYAGTLESRLASFKNNPKVNIEWAQRRGICESITLFCIQRLCFHNAQCARVCSNTNHTQQQQHAEGITRGQFTV